MKHAKRLLVTAFAVAMAFSLVGCECDHEWEDATCTDPETCELCGETFGKPLGHDWEEATCTEPKTCKTCGETEGEALGHDWEEATCTEPKTCKNCGETEGEALGHDWEEATCTEPKTCKNCGEKEGEPSECKNFKTEYSDIDHMTATRDCTKVCKDCGKENGTTKETVSCFVEDYRFTFTIDEFCERLNNVMTTSYTGSNFTATTKVLEDYVVITVVDKYGFDVGVISFFDENVEMINRENRYERKLLAGYITEPLDSYYYSTSDLADLMTYTVMTIDPSITYTDAKLLLLETLAGKTPIENSVIYYAEEIDGRDNETIYFTIPDYYDGEIET